MGIEELLKDQREDILRIASKHGARNVRVFGSVARGEAKANSDVDFLVEMEPGRSLLDHVAFIQDLEDQLGIEVDVVTEKASHRHIRDRVLQEALPLSDGKTTSSLSSKHERTGWPNYAVATRCDGWTSLDQLPGTTLTQPGATWTSWWNLSQAAH